MQSLSAISASCRNLAALIDDWVDRARTAEVPDWDGLQVAAGTLYRLAAIEKTILALRKQGNKADSTYLKKLCAGVEVLQKLFDLSGRHGLLDKPIPLPPLAPLRPLAAPAQVEHACPPCESTALPSTEGGHSCPSCDPIASQSPTSVVHSPGPQISHQSHLSYKSHPIHKPNFSLSGAQRDPFDIPRARLNPPSPRSGAVTLHSFSSSHTPGRHSPSEGGCESCESCSLPLEFTYAPQPLSLEPRPKLPKSIALLSNWHKAEGHPALLAQMHHTLSDASAAILKFFKNLPEKPADYLSPAYLHTSLPIISFIYPDAASPPPPVGASP